MSENARVPFWLRGAISRSCKVGPFGAWGRSCYGLIARHCARRLAGFPGADTVFLRGKEVRDSDPGISDLDFWLFCKEAELCKPEDLHRIRTAYQKLKGYSVLPGKLEVTSGTAWEYYRTAAPATFLEDLPLRQLTATGWVKKCIGPAQPPRLLSRFNLGMFNYLQALSHLPGTTGGRSAYYNSAVLVKYLHKAIDAANGWKPGPNAAVPHARLLAEAFLALHHLAQAALRNETVFSAVDFTLRSPLADQEGAIAAPHHEQLKVFLTQNGFPVDQATVPEFLLWDPDGPDPEAAVQLFSTLIHYHHAASAADKPNLPGQRPATILSRPMFKCLWRGSRLGPLLENLASIPEECELPQGGAESLKRSIFLYFLERLVTRVNHTPGVAVSYPAATFRTPLLCQCMELLIVNARHVTNDLDLLCGLSKTQLPLTVYWFERLREGRLPTDYAGWMEAFVQLRSESMPVLAALEKGGYGGR